MIKMRKLIKEGIIDGLTPSFIIDSGVNESTVSYKKKTFQLPQYSVWGYNSMGEAKIMENGNNVDSLIQKYELKSEDIIPIDGTIKETIRKIGKSKWGVFARQSGKRLGTHDSKDSAKNQLAAIEINKKKNENLKNRDSING